MLFLYLVVKSNCLFWLSFSARLACVSSHIFIGSLTPTPHSHPASKPRLDASKTPPPCSKCLNLQDIFQWKQPAHVAAWKREKKRKDKETVLHCWSSHWLHINASQTWCNLKHLKLNKTNSSPVPSWVLQSQQEPHHADIPSGLLNQQESRILWLNPAFFFHKD